MLQTVVIIISVLLNACAQLFLKMGAGRLTANAHTLTLIKEAVNVPMLLGFGCYGLSILLWIYALSKVEVSYAYPFQALGYIVVAFTSFFLLHESLTASKLIGISLIALGVFFIARTAGTA